MTFLGRHFARLTFLLVQGLCHMTESDLLIFSIHVLTFVLFKHIVFLSAYPGVSVCVHKTSKPVHNVNRAFIFQMYIPCDKRELPAYIPCDKRELPAYNRFNLVTLTLKFDLRFKNFNLVHNFVLGCYF